MPKIPSKPTSKEKGRLETKQLAKKLLEISSQMGQLSSELDSIWEQLYTKGLTECGPITEDKSDIPF